MYEPDVAAWEPKERTLQVVIEKADPPRLLGVLMPRLPDDDEAVVRYYDTGPDEEEHFAHSDEVIVYTVTVEV